MPKVLPFLQTVEGLNFQQRGRKILFLWRVPN